MNITNDNPHYHDYGADARAMQALVVVGDHPEEDKPPIGVEEIRRAAETLQAYKSAKSALESRLLDEEKWFRLRQNDERRRQEMTENVEKNHRDPSSLELETPTSAWLFNSICNKHADAMDNYPTAVCLPREQADVEDAKLLSSILPVVMERNNFEGIYSDAEWYKQKHGMAAYGVFWDETAEDGRGDIKITYIDILNLFWQPGIRDIQDSRNLFIVGLVDKESLATMYPHFDPKEAVSNSPINAADYVGEESRSSCEDFALVVDWYYKVRTSNGRTLLHFCKFTGETVLFASENDPLYAETGWYEHGQYPVELDVLYPLEGSCTGFGLISVGRNPQTYIDRLDRNIIRYTDIASRVRYWAKRSMGIDADDFADLDKLIVEVEGDIDEEKLRQITISPMDGTVVSVKELKINELKETTGARDVSQGSTAGGVTAAAAIAALQEAGNKGSRDMLASSYRTYVRVVRQVINLIRQFYDETRTFRITGEQSSAGGYTFVQYKNNRAMAGDPLLATRRPVYDIDVKAAKMNPYNQLSQNEIMKELYGMGIFNPGNAQQALAMLSGMNFDGIEQVREYVRQGETLQNQLGQMMTLVSQLTGLPADGLTALMSGGMGGMPQAEQGSGGGSDLQKALEGGLEATRTDYGRRLAEQARANASDVSTKRTEVQ